MVESTIDESFFASIVESADDAIIGQTLDGTIRSWNRGAERLYGYTAAEAIGCSLALIFPPDRLDELQDILARIRRGERAANVETVRQRKDGTAIDIILNVWPLRDQSGA